MTQLDALVQDTPPSSLASGPLLGMVTTDHRFPFQDSARLRTITGCTFQPPTASQFVALGQDTPLNQLLPRLATLGLGMTDQRLPFQDSAKVSIPNAPSCEPTATQLAALRQLMLLSTLFEPMLGLGITDQAFPFQDSTKVAVAWLRLPRSPTATHLVALRQDTPSSPLSLPAVPLSPGVGVIDQAFPSQVSTRGLLVIDDRESNSPTATQNDELVQDTPDSPTGLTLPRGVGLGMIDQARPFQAAVKVAMPPPKLPTAMQNFEPGQDTPESWSVPVPRLGVGVTDHREGTA